MSRAERGFLMGFWYRDATDKPTPPIMTMLRHSKKTKSHAGSVYPAFLPLVSRFSVALAHNFTCGHEKPRRRKVLY